MNNEHPVDPGSGANTGTNPELLEDATIVASAGHALEATGDNGSVGDETIVVTNDETVVVAIDHTVVVTRHETHATGDETVVVTSEETVVVPGAAPKRRRDRSLAARRKLEESGSSTPAPPVQEASGGVKFTYGVDAGLDSDRPIAPVPGTLPWEVPPSGERGLSQGLPVSYGARMHTATPLQTGVDEVQRRVGPAPEAAPVYVVEGRAQLPSMQRKDLRRKRATLGIYGGVILACVLGLWGVAVIAFG